MTRTRVGVIGAGLIARRHVDDLRTFEDVEVVAVADTFEERARELAADVGARAYSSHEAMLEREGLDAVYICVPPFAHGAPELAVVEHGLPFFVEKPIAVDLEIAETIGAAVADAGLVTGVGYHFRYLDTVERAQELLADRPARLALGYWLDSTPPPSWWIRRGESGGQVIEQATHIIDLARVLVGDVTEVAALGGRVPRDAFPEADIAETSAATLRFDTGALGTLATTCLLEWRHRVELHLFCEGLAIEISEFDIVVDVGRGRPVVERQVDPFLREDRDFIDAVQGKPVQLRAPYEEALRTHRVACAIARSADEGRAVQLDR